MFNKNIQNIKIWNKKRSGSFLFLASFVVSLAILITIAKLKLIPKIDISHSDIILPKTTQEFISNSEIDHHIFQHGLFNFSKKIQAANIYLLSSSHVQFGLNARQIEEALRKEGFEAKVLNLGLGHAESLGVAKHIFEQNGVECGILIVDGYESLRSTNSSLSDEIWKRSISEGYYQVASEWIKFFRNIAWNSILPRIEIEQGKASFTSQYSKSTMIRDWNYGDLIEYMSPTQGRVFTKFPKSKQARAYLGSDTSVLYKLKDNDTVLKWFKEKKDNFYIIMTLLPYDNYDETTCKRRAKALGIDYVSIPPDGITTYDTYHMVQESREKATQELIQGIMRSEKIIAKIKKQLEVCNFRKNQE